MSESLVDPAGAVRCGEDRRMPRSAQERVRAGHALERLQRMLDSARVDFIPSGVGVRADQREREALTIEPYRPSAVVMQRRSLLRALLMDWPEVDPLAVRRSIHGGPRRGATHILDLCGVYIPGQGSPLAAVLVGPTRSTYVRVLRCVRGEPRVPEDPAEGAVFKDVLARWDIPGETPWTRVTDFRRTDGRGIASLLADTFGGGR